MCALTIPSTGSHGLCGRGSSRIRHRALAVHLKSARNFAARLDFYLRISDRPGNTAGRANQQPFADRELALKAAPHVGIVGRGLPLENTSLEMITFWQFGNFALMPPSTTRRSQEATSPDRDIP